jgi:hypothetical protein
VVTPVEYLDWVPRAIQRHADALLDGRDDASPVRRQILRLVTAPEMRSVWETLVQAGVNDGVPHDEEIGDLDDCLNSFFAHAANCPMPHFIDEQQFREMFAAVAEREKRGALMAAKLREVAAELREVGTELRQVAGLRRGFMPGGEDIIKVAAHGAAAIEQTARDLEEEIRKGLQARLRPRGRNRGRTRERVYACDLAYGIRRFNLSNNALHTVIATTTSVVFENEIETYRVRDWLKSS